MKKRTKKIKNTILKIYASTLAIIWAFSACSLDSENYLLPLAVCVISFALLSLFAYANGAMGGERID